MTPETSNIPDKITASAARADDCVVVLQTEFDNIRTAGEKRPELDDDSDQENRRCAGMIVFHHWIAGCPGQTIHRIGGFGIHLPPPRRRIG
jgi:hypothetical protein